MMRITSGIPAQYTPCDALHESGGLSKAPSAFLACAKENRLRRETRTESVVPVPGCWLIKKKIRPSDHARPDDRLFKQIS
jgi:hypothetical protein